MVKYNYCSIIFLTMKIDKSSHYDSLIESYERRLKQRDRQKRARMKVSGGGVKGLKIILSNKINKVKK